MRKVVMIFLSMMLVSVFAYAKGLEIKKRAGSLEVSVRFDKDSPTVGKNKITIEIKDGQGHYVRDAKVKLEYSMPAMSGMPPMNYKTNAELKGDEYRAEMDLSMTGPWNITVKIIRAGKTETARFSIDVR